MTPSAFDTRDLQALDPLHPRHPARSLQAVMQHWGGQGDLWIFGYASLIWRPDFDFTERHFAQVHGYHRALKMWSRVNRGSKACPGLVFGLLPGGSCKGVVFRLPGAKVAAILPALWDREMPNGVYDAKWLQCKIQAPSNISSNIAFDAGSNTATNTSSKSRSTDTVTALAFTLSKRSPNFTGVLESSAYQQIFANATGRFGSTLDYAQQTHDGLRAVGIHDQALAQLLTHAQAASKLPL